MSGNPARLLLVGQVPPPHHGSNVMVDATMTALHEAGLNPLLVSRDFSRSLHEVGSATPAKAARLLRVWIRFRRAAKRHRGAPIVYFVSVSKMAFLVDCLLLLTASGLRNPVYLYFHGRGYMRLAESPRWDAIIRRSFGRAAGGIVLSRSLVSDVNRWIPEDRLHIVPNAIPDRPAPFRGTGRPLVRFLSLSNLVATKGALEFVEAAHEIARDFPTARFTVAGQSVESDYARRVEAAMTSGSDSDRFERLGGVYGDAKAALLSRCDAFVFPTYYPFETFGLVNLEAMRAGMPVIATNVGAIPDVVLDGVTGFVIPPREPARLLSAMRDLAMSEERRLQLGAAGRRHFEANFTMDIFRQRWGDLGRAMLRAAETRTRLLRPHHGGDHEEKR